MLDNIYKNSQELSGNNLHLAPVLLADIIIKPMCEQAFIKTSEFINLTSSGRKVIIIQLF
ncbi:hypothetical protein BV372_33755 [Nostoc sp. T09]|nr:hypothetical protein BV372_33755 [Nostoc sp. T09]